MFKVQHRTGPKAAWKDLRGGKMYATEAEAWAAVASFDPDGFVDRLQYRVVKA